jgi:retron-type reverse transcriptase
MEHFYNSNLFAENQFGFRKGLATEDAIFKLTNKILNSLNNKIMIGSVFCDLDKAFDTVNHELLLSKLDYYGISGKAKSLLELYLQNRCHIFNSYSDYDTVSGWTKITQGVPQGSILGPLLFLIYINDLPNTVEPKAIPIIFADDTSILVTSPNNNQFQKELNTVFCQINKWFKDNLISLNLNKTYIIQFSNKSIGNSNIQIVIEDAH